MASFASSATSCGARKHAWTKKKVCFFWGGGSGDPFFWHESSSWVEISLHTKFGRVWSREKVGDGLVWFVVFLGK